VAGQREQLQCRRHWDARRIHKAASLLLQGALCVCGRGVWCIDCGLACQSPKRSPTLASFNGASNSSSAVPALAACDHYMH
jgi:hypothetical protein